MIYEIREYTTVPGRMPALVRRFREHTLELFVRHGIEVEFISLTEDDADELVYVVRYASAEDMATRWNAFRTDPDWLRVRAASEADGPIVASIRSRVLDPAPFA